MTAIYNKHNGNYKITLNRKEAEALAYYSSEYSILFTALDCWPDAESLNYYGSKARVASDLAKAQKH